MEHIKMRNFKPSTSLKVNFGIVTGLIFDACRANSERITKQIGAFRIEFDKLNDSEYLVFVYLDEKTVIATAIIDESDL